MQTIQVEMLTLDDNALFYVNKKKLAEIWRQQHDVMSEIKRNIHRYGGHQDFHYTLDGAIEFVQESITEYFAYAGVPVEFIAK